MVLGEGHRRGAPPLDLYDGLSLRWGTPETSLSCGRRASRGDNAGHRGAEVFTNRDCRLDTLLGCDSGATQI